MDRPLSKAGRIAVPALLAFFCAAPAHAIPANWTAGAGNWSSATNWDIPFVPCNTGPTGFDVTIPASTGPVTQDVGVCTIDSLNLGTGTTLVLAPGGALSSAGNAVIDGVINGNGGILIAPTANLLGGSARIFASNGADIELGSTGYATLGLNFSVTLIDVTGIATLVDLAAVEILDAQFDDSSVGASAQRIAASDGAFVDLSGLTDVLTPARREDRIDFEISDSATIDLSGLETTGGVGAVRFTAQDGATLELPALQNLASARLNAVTGGTISAIDSLFAYSTTALNFSQNVLNADGAGSTLDLAGMTNLDAGFDDASVGASAQTVIAANSAVISLAGLTSITSPLRREDRLDIVVNGSSSIDLSSLSDIAGGGSVLIQALGGATIELPALQSVATARIVVDAGSTLRANGSAFDYSTLAVNFSNTLISCTGPVATLDLSSMATLNAAYDDASVGASAQTIRIDDCIAYFSGLTQVTGPVRREDRLDFVAIGNAVVALEALETTFGPGSVRFDAQDGATLLLPSLNLVNDAGFIAASGGSVAAGAPSWSYASLGRNFSNTLVSADGAGSLLDLSGMSNWNAAYDDASVGQSIQTAAASDQAVVDLSALTSLTTPVRVEDVIRYSADSGARVDLSALILVQGNGRAQLLGTGAGILAVGRLSGAEAPVLISVTDAGTTLETPDGLAVGNNVTVTAGADTMVVTGGNIDYRHSAEADFDLSASALHVEGAGAVYVEAGGFDIGALTPADSNFGLGRLVVGTDTTTAVARLRDARDNGNNHDICSSPREAHYLFGDAGADGLQLKSGSTLYLDGVNLYASISGVMTHLNPLVTPGVPLGFDAGFIDTGTVLDADADGIPDQSDNCAVAANPDQRDSNGDGIGNICDADLNNDLLVNFGDLAAMKAAFVPNPYNADADLNGDGLVNFGDLARMKALFLLPPGPACP